MLLVVYACLVLWEDYVSGYFFCFEFFGLQICDQLWGPLAKTMTEKAAWALARDKELDMVVINPAIVLGPKLLTSRASIMNYLQGLLLPPLPHHHQLPNNSSSQMTCSLKTMCDSVFSPKGKFWLLLLLYGNRDEGAATKWLICISAC